MAGRYYQRYLCMVREAWPVSGLRRMKFTRRGLADELEDALAMLGSYLLGAIRQASDHRLFAKSISRTRSGTSARRISTVMGWKTAVPVELSIRQGCRSRPDFAPR